MKCSKRYVLFFSNFLLFLFIRKKKYSSRWCQRERQKIVDINWFAYRVNHREDEIFNIKRTVLFRSEMFVFCFTNRLKHTCYFKPMVVRFLNVFKAIRFISLNYVEDCVFGTFSKF